MAGFVEQLWESVFTPGPTPTLLLATNITFACLQLVLLTLLIATYSVHFIALSFLSAGLWWAINWFVTELNALKAKEEAIPAQADPRPALPGTEDSGTEVETTIQKTIPETGSRDIEPIEQMGDMKFRAEHSFDAKSAVSTEDEWERVSESEKDK
ncbi:ER protein Pkr1-domain-containing protein [Xylaria sp. CBS 124048]|nr:ER protein Pkr1-domain-containing protein [Xylaria sp. CBS 124048]